MLIHGAIIAREYGIPCVTGVPTPFTGSGPATRYRWTVTWESSPARGLKRFSTSRVRRGDRPRQRPAVSPYPVSSTYPSPRPARRGRFHGYRPPLPIPDGGSQFLVRDAGKTSSSNLRAEAGAASGKDSGRRSPGSSRIRGPRSARRRRKGSMGTVREDQRAGAERVGPAALRAEPVEHQVPSVRKLQGEPVPPACPFSSALVPHSRSSQEFPSTGNETPSTRTVPRVRAGSSSSSATRFPGRRPSAESPIPLGHDRPRGVEDEVDRRTTISGPQPDRRVAAPPLADQSSSHTGTAGRSPGEAEGAAPGPLEVVNRFPCASVTAKCAMYAGSSPARPPVGGPGRMRNGRR